jgi:hypothetical protein
LFLGFGRVDRVAVFCIRVGPRDGDREQWVESVDYCWYDLCLL